MQLHSLLALEYALFLVRQLEPEECLGNFAKSSSVEGPHVKEVRITEVWPEKQAVARFHLS